MKQTDSTVFRVGFSHFVVLYRTMLFIYPIILLCFNLVYIDCDVPNRNLEKNPRRINFASRYVRPSEISTTTETIDIIGTSVNDLPPQILIDHGEPKKNITRVRKQKTRRVINKTIVPNDNNLSLEKIKEPEIATIAVAKFGEEHIEKKDLEQSIERNEKKIEPKQSSRLQVTNSPAKVNSEIQEKAVTEKFERNKNNVGGPRTFPKRPAEFNPVFKKRRERDPVVRIINEKNYVYGHNGNFHFSFEGADGTKVFSKGNLLSSPIRQQKAGEAVVGGFAYKDEQGNDYSLSYTADEHGYQPVGAHLPTPPPIPPEIARALEFLATKPNPEPTEKYYSYY